ncbi:hypothetical protein EXIGLDRAFT_38536, partial [Exidia glandulosa HHB12029]
MRAFKDLPLEMLLEVLEYVDDLDTLLAAITSHKRWHSVYNAYPKSFSRRVLRNNLGPEVHASALCTIRVTTSVPPNVRVLPYYPPTAGRRLHFFDRVRFRFAEARMRPESTTDAEYAILYKRARICDELELVY